MVQVMGIHDMNDINVDPNKSIAGDPWEAYKTACKSVGCSPQHVHLSDAVGRAYCITNANSVDEVRKAHNLANVKLQDAFEVETKE